MTESSSFLNLSCLTCMRHVPPKRVYELEGSLAQTSIILWGINMDESHTTVTRTNDYSVRQLRFFLAVVRCSMLQFLAVCCSVLQCATECAATKN
mmetsp:Transcript_101112/g.163107  ORF Transcript_101112/g.163107 Transcript_101112/m.163107 type:complete len:95 (+) Transcript_101112:58-342(+)